MKKRRFRRYEEELIESLKDPVEAAAYLNAALEEGDKALFLLALKHVAEAFGGMRKLSKKTKLNRESLYRMLSKRGNPELHSLYALLKTLGLEFTIRAQLEHAA